MRLMFSEYSPSGAFFLGAGLTGFYSTTGGGAIYSTYSFLAGGGAVYCSAAFSGFLILAAEGGLLGLTSFFSSFFSGSGSPFPRTLLTNGSDDFPLVAHLKIC
jgi:hypothetical protein